MGTPIASPALGDIGMIELLECDSRPTFILDLDDTIQDPNDKRLDTAFSNASIQRLSHILDPAQVRRDTPMGYNVVEQFSRFRKWATSSSTHDSTADGYIIPFEYQNLLWVGSTLRKRWRIISGSAIGLETSAGLLPSPAGSQPNIHGMSTKPMDIRPPKENGKLQAGIHRTWVDDLPMSEHVQFSRARIGRLRHLGLWKLGLLVFDR